VNSKEETLRLLSQLRPRFRPLYKALRGRMQGTRAGIFKQSMGVMNRVGIGLSYGYTAWRNWFLGIDSWTPYKFKNSGSEC
jgi:hypothetical protein